ncbi:MAG: hypothetical protein ACKOU7_04495 [Ferruginibacter sp.]
MKKYFFQVTSILIFIFSVIGFSDNLFTDVGQKSNSDPKFIIHGLCCFAWIVILVIQANFIRTGNIKAHVKLGIAGMVAAAGVFITTVYIFVVIYKGWDAMPYYVKSNRLFMPLFGIWVWLGYRNRKKPVLHKRFMYIATLYMLGPILDRAIDHFYLDRIMSEFVMYDVTVKVIWGLFFIFLFMYDWKTLRKVHPLSITGAAFFVITWLIAIYT